MASPGGFLRPASFRGVPFFSRRGTRAFPRSLQIDEYPASDRWSVVNLGRKAVTYREDMYVADEANVEARMQALEAALEADGAGLLILPQRRPVMAWARTPESTWEWNQLGYYTFKVDFVEDGPAAGAGLSLGLAERIIVDALATVAGIATAAGIRLDSVAADLRGPGLYEATAFAREGAARLASLKLDALAITAETEVVEAVQTATGWAGQADIVEALSVAGDAGLTALEQRAAA